MHLRVLDGARGMCANGGQDEVLPSSPRPSQPSKRSATRCTLPSSSRMTAANGTDDHADPAEDGRTAASLASCSAPASTSSAPSSSATLDNHHQQHQQPSQRATSIPDPPGADGFRGRPSMPPSSRRQPSATTLSALLEPFNPPQASTSSSSPPSCDHGKAAHGRAKIPSTSRAGADIAEQRTVSGVGLLESWKYLPFLAHQASKLATAFVSHHVFGPPKKSWGIELTLFTTAIRESVQYSHLSSLPTLRRFLSLGQILPVPKDGVVTPVIFQIYKRNLPGILADLDDKEDGTREVTGEWVVSKRIWRRMQREHYGNPSGIPPASNRAGAPSSRRKSSLKNTNDSAFEPPPSKPASSTKPSQRRRLSSSFSAHPSLVGSDKVILYLHGGAYYTMSAATHRYITISVSKYTNCRVFAVNYRLAPECRWPGQIHDAVQSYLRLIQDLKIPPEMIIIMGDSAGGGLTLATIMYLRDHGFPLPCGAIVMSPWVDLTMSCDSWETNAPYDYLRMPSGDDHMNPIASLLGAANVKNLITHPYVSPLFGDFHDFPPLLIQCGDAECLRDEGTLLAHKASLAGVQVYHEVYEDCPHVFQAMFFLEASKKAFRSHRNFVKNVLPSFSPSSASAGSTLNNNKMDKVNGATGADRKVARGGRVDLSEMDQEVMSDAHNVKPDGQAELQSLPASPRALQRELSSLTPLHSKRASLSSTDAIQGTSDSTGSGQLHSLDETVGIADNSTGFLEEEGDLGYDDEDEDDERSNPFNVESSCASATTSEMDDEDSSEPLQPSSDVGPIDRDDSRDTEQVSHHNPMEEFALNATAGMVKLGTKLTTSAHHDLDSVAEEQDENIGKMEYEENKNTHDNTMNSSFTFPRNTSSHRLQPGYQHQHYHQQHRRTSRSTSSTPSQSPSASLAALPQSPPSGSHTPLASRTPASSAPSSPGASLRNSNRQRSFSSLSMASLTPSNSLKRPTTSQLYGTPKAAMSDLPSRPDHSRSNSSVSVRTMKPGHFREMSKPRARANSHPDLQALLDSYDAAGPAQHTILWGSEEDGDEMEGRDGKGQTGKFAERRVISSDDDSMDYDTFDT